MNRRALAALAAAVALGSVAAVLALTRPAPPPPAPTRPMAVERASDDPPAARDDEGHFAPGSPAAVAERFLRARLRYRYDEAATLATGGERARCERNVALFRAMPPEQRETVRQGQLIAEAATFDLERAVTDALPPGPNGAARKQVRGVVHARGPVEGHTVESSRAQTLVLELVDGAWRVAEWTPGASDGGITVR
jgi:hypothetical protein